MKKKVLIAMFGLLVLTIVGVCFSNAKSRINPDCPNGCVDRRGGCHCFLDYPHYGEAKWSSTISDSHLSEQ